MGFSPRQVGEMSPWEFGVCLEAYGKSKGWQTGPTDKPMSIDRLRELGIEGF